MSDYTYAYHVYVIELWDYGRANVTKRVKIQIHIENLHWAR